MENPGPGMPGMGSPEAEMSPERAVTPEALMRQRELYTVEGTGHILRVKEAVASADMVKIRESVEEGIGFMEGLSFSIYLGDYDLSDRHVAGELQNLFTSSEGAVARHQYGNVFSAIREGLTDAVDRANRYQRAINRPEGKDGWRAAYLGERLAYWRYVNESRAQQGALPLTASQMAERAQDEVDAEQARLDRLVESKNDLIALKDHLDARHMFDVAFRYRLADSVCDVDDFEIKANAQRQKPDKGQFLAYYQGNKDSKKWEQTRRSDWGEAVDKAERAIERVAKGTLKVRDLKGNEIQDDPDNDFKVREWYVRGFRNAADFTAWLDTIAGESMIEGEKRLDVVWAAWKMAIWKERISKLAWRVNENGEYEFGNPPLTTDLSQKVMHGEKLRAHEFMWKAVMEISGKKYVFDWDQKVRFEIDEKGYKVGDDIKLVERDYMRQPETMEGYKAVSHSGHPLSIGRFSKDKHKGPLVDDFMSEQKIAGWGVRPREASPSNWTLEEIWEGCVDPDPGRAIAPVSMAHEDFPWASMELKKPGQKSDEQAAGGAGVWYLSRLRGGIARTEIIRAIPEPGKMGMDFLSTPTMRMLKKIKQIRPGELNSEGVPDNPMAWWFAGCTVYWSNAVDRTNPYLQGERGFTKADKIGKQGGMREGELWQGTLTERDRLANAERIGIISQAEREWIDTRILIPIDRSIPTTQERIEEMIEPYFEEKVGRFARKVRNRVRR